MSNTDDADWEEQLEDYIDNHPNLLFTEVARLISEKLQIPLDEVLSNEDSRDFINNIWDTDDGLDATELIDIIARASRISVKQLLLDPNGREALNDFYKDKATLEVDELDPMLYRPSPPVTSLPGRLEDNTNRQSTPLPSAYGPSQSRTLPGAQPPSNIKQSSTRSSPNSNAKSRTSADRVAAFGEMPGLILGAMKDNPWRKISDGIHAIVKQVASRLGQAQFRRDLFDNYGCRCLITGCTVPHVVEAAHIRPYKSRGNFDVENGLLLRSDLHMLFDQNLLTFHPETKKVELHPKLLETEYACYQDHVLQVENAKIQPDKQALQERYEAFKQTQKTANYTYAEPLQQTA